MHFGQGAKKFTLNGGDFKEISGNYTVTNQKGLETSTNAWNTHKKSDSYKGFDDQTLRSHLDRDHQEEEGPPRKRHTTDGREDYPGHPPYPYPHAQFTPRRDAFGGGRVTDPNSLSIRNTQNNDAFHNYPQYDDRAPPTNQRRRDRPQGREICEETTIPDMEEDADHPSNGGLFGNGQIPFQTKPKQHVRTGVRPGPPTRVDNHHPVQRMNQTTFPKVTKQTRSPSEEYDAQNVPGDVDENYESDDADYFSSRAKDESHPWVSAHLVSPPTIAKTDHGSQKPSTRQATYPMGHSHSTPSNSNSHHIYSNPLKSSKSDGAEYPTSHGTGAHDSMSTRMANLSIRDPIPPPRPREESHSQFPAHLSPSPSMTRGNYGPLHKLNATQVYPPMDYPSPPKLSNYNNPVYHPYSNPIKNYKSDDIDYPPSYGIGGEDFTSTGLVDPPNHDPRFPPRSREQSHSQSPIHLTPPPIMTRGKHGHPVNPNTPQVYNTMGYVKTSDSSPYNNPLAQHRPHSNESNPYYDTG